jgi:hypothetical protein
MQHLSKLFLIGVVAGIAAAGIPKMGFRAAIVRTSFKLGSFAAWVAASVAAKPIAAAAGKG